MSLPELQKSIQRSGWWAFWSSWQHTNAGGTLSGQAFEYFATRVNQPGQGFTNNTFAETNMRQAGQMPAQMGMIVHAMAFTFFNGAAQAPVSSADAHNIIDGAIVQWNWSESQTDIGPLAMIGSGGQGLYGVGGTAGGVAAEIALGNGGYHVFRKPVTIAANATFSVRVLYPVLNKAAPVITTIGKMTIIGELTSLVDAG